MGSSDRRNDPPGAEKSGRVVWRTIMKILTYWFARLFRKGHKPAPGYGAEVLFSGWVDLPSAVRVRTAERTSRRAPSSGRFAHG